LNWNVSCEGRESQNRESLFINFVFPCCILFLFIAIFIYLFSICEARSKNTNQRTPPRTEGELLLDDLPPIEDLHITVTEQECMEVGKVSGIVDKMGKNIVFIIIM
jgi:hypothetical protein